MVLGLFSVAFVGYFRCQHDRKAILGTALIVEFGREKTYFDHIHVAAFSFGWRNVLDAFTHMENVTKVSYLLLIGKIIFLSYISEKVTKEKCRRSS